MDGRIRKDFSPNPYLHDVMRHFEQQEQNMQYKEGEGKVSLFFF